MWRHSSANIVKRLTSVCTKYHLFGYIQKSNNSCHGSFLGKLINFRLFDRKEWANLGQMTKEDAMVEFIKLLNTCCPLFSPYVVSHKIEKEEQERKRWTSSHFHSFFLGSYISVQTWKVYVTNSPTRPELILFTPYVISLVFPVLHKKGNLNKQLVCPDPQQITQWFLFVMTALYIWILFLHGASTV